MKTERFEKRLRRVYEISRLRNAIAWSIPAVTFALLAYLAAWDTQHLIVGVIMVALAIWGFWYGRKVAPMIFPALGVGLIAYVLAQFAAPSGHSCSLGCCSSWCMQSCTLGGFIGGVCVAYWAWRSRGGFLPWATGALLVFLSGALGCQSMSASSLIGLTLGIIGSRVLVFFTRKRIN